MLKKSVSNLNSQKLRMLLLVTILLIVAASVGIFVYTKTALTSYAAEVQKVSDVAALSNQNLSALATLQQKLESNADAVERTKSLVAESKHYAYQDQIIKDINTYASASGVTIVGYQFDGADQQAATGTTTQPTPELDPATGLPVKTDGLKTVRISVTLKSPLAFKNVMEFINKIEQNLTKMQLTDIAFAKDPAPPHNLSVSSLSIEVYTR